MNAFEQWISISPKNLNFVGHNYGENHQKDICNVCPTFLIPNAYTISEKCNKIKWRMDERRIIKSLGLERKLMILSRL